MRFLIIGSKYSVLLASYLTGTGGCLVDIDGLACLALARMQRAVMTTEASDVRRPLATATPTMTPGTASPLSINASPSPVSITPLTSI